MPVNVNRNTYRDDVKEALKTVNAKHGITQYAKIRRGVVDVATSALTDPAYAWNTGSQPVAAPVQGGTATP